MRMATSRRSALNLTRFAETLLPLFADNEKDAVSQAESVLKPDMARASKRRIMRACAGNSVY